jgi:hypothetical protein
VILLIWLVPDVDEENRGKKVEAVEEVNSNINIGFPA